MFILAPNPELHRRAGGLASPSLAGSSTSSTTSGTSSMFDSHFSSSTDMSSPDEDAHKMLGEGGSYGNSYSMTRSNSMFFSRDCDPSTPTQFSFKRDKNMLELRVDIPFYKTAARSKLDSSFADGVTVPEVSFQAISVSPDIERQRSASHEEIWQPPKVVLRPQEMPESPSPILSLPSPYLLLGTPGCLLSEARHVLFDETEPATPMRQNAVGPAYVGLGLALPSDGSPEASVPNRPKLTRSTSSRRHISYLAEKVQSVAVSPLLHKLQKVTIGSPKSPHSPTASPPSPPSPSPRVARLMKRPSMLLRNAWQPPVSPSPSSPDSPSSKLSVPDSLPSPALSPLSLPSPLLGPRRIASPVTVASFLSRFAT